MRLAAVVAAIALAVPMAAGAQPGADLDVSVGAGWFGPGRPLRLVVEATAGPAVVPDTRLSVAIGERLRSRSDLAATLGRTSLSDPIHAFTVALPDLAADERRRVTITRSVPDLGAFLGAPDGLYPVSVALRTSTGPALATAVTAVAYLGADPAKPISVLPVLDLTGSPAAPGTAADGDALRRAFVDARAVGHPLAVTFSPAVIDQVDADAMTPAVRALDGREVLTVPYTNTVLGHLAQDDVAAVAGRLALGVRRLRSLTGEEPAQLVHPPALALDADGLDLLREVGVRAALVSGAGLGSSATTRATPADADGVLLVPVDDGIAAASRAATTDLDVAAAVADAAMVYFEAPGRTRLIAAVASSRSPRALEILSRISAAPWARPVGVEDALLAVPSDEADPFPVASTLPAPFSRALAEARSAVADHRSLTLEDNEPRRRFAIDLRAAAGTAWWADDWGAGVAYTRALRDAARAELSGITATGSTVTFTSRSGQVPIVVTNDAGYPVRVRLEVSSPKLEFPEGSTRVLDPLPPPGTTVTFPSLASASGTFSLTVRLTTVDERVVLATEEIVVRSLAVNLSAVILTVGGGAIVAIWGIRRAVSRRRDP